MTIRNEPVTASSIQSMLDRELHRLDFPKHWPCPTLSFSTSIIGQLKFFTIALEGQHDHQSISVSTVDSREIPVKRTLLKWIGQLSVLDVLKHDGSTRSLKPIGKLTGTRTEHSYNLQSLFPEPQPCHATAAHYDLHSASRKAYLRLIECDLILRSWYYGTPIRQKNGNPHLRSKSLRLMPDYSLEAYEIIAEQSHWLRPKVACTLARPGDSTRPLIYGFGSGLHLTESIMRATEECCQRVVLSQKSHSALGTTTSEEMKNWLEGRHPKAIHKTSVNLPTIEKSNILFFDITPHSLIKQIRVVKAVCPMALPLPMHPIY